MSKRWSIALATAVLATAVFFAAGNLFAANGDPTPGLPGAYRVRGERVREKLLALRNLREELNLTPEQQTEVRAILAEQRDDLAELRRQVGPTVVARLRKTDREITAVLTPDQTARWREMVERFRRNWLPPRAGAG